MGVTPTVSMDHAPGELSGRQLRRAIAASAIGSAIEWYDFLVYATVSGPT
jgi:hypothetical protein